MILKIVIGRGARGLLNYVSQLSKSSHHPHPAQKRGEPKQHTLPTFSNFAGSTPRQIAAEFSALRLLKPNLNKAVGHLILSPGPTDRALSKDEWQKALSLALQVHGAGGAPHAAYLHDDTDLQHLHVFFSRILPTGEVVSDSQSYQKNRNAARQIEKELQMETLNSNPKPDAPGDRQAAYNAAKRSERLGVQGQINQTQVRAALKEAKDLADFEIKLRELGIEAEFSRRGSYQEIFGWKLRVIGQERWQKASTLAKDLSWPNIEHRFAEAPAPAPNPTFADDFIRAPSSAQQPDTTKPPAPTKRKAEPNEDDVHAGATMLVPAPISTAASERRKKRFVERKLEIQQRVGSSNFSKALAQLGLALSHFAIEIIARFVELLKHLLSSKFGIGVQGQVTQAPSGRQQVTLQVDDDTIEEEARLIEPQPEPLSLDYRLEEASEVVEHITRAIQDQNFESLPDAGAKDRDALVSEFQNVFGSNPVPSPKLDPAALFAAGVRERLLLLGMCITDRRAAKAAFDGELTRHDNYPLVRSIDDAEKELRALKAKNERWIKEHPLKSFAGVLSGHERPIIELEIELASMLKQREADKPKRKTASAALAAADTRLAEADAAAKKASTALYQSAVCAMNFGNDPRFYVLSMDLPKQVKALTDGVSIVVAGQRQVDLKPHANALLLALDDWAEAAKKPLPSAPKPLLKEEQIEKPDEDGFERPR